MFSKTGIVQKLPEMEERTLPLLNDVYVDGFSILKTKTSEESMWPELGSFDDYLNSMFPDTLVTKE